MTTVGRNDPCPCGSGRRFKQCCGALAASAPASATTEAMALMQAALAAQTARALDDAERLYRAALDKAPDQPDALHMLGVVCYEKRDYAQARRLIERALDLTGWQIPQYRHNFGLVLSRANDARGQLGLNRRRVVASSAAARQPVADAEPAVAIVVPAYRHAEYVGEAMRSVLAQTWRRLEIVVIDDGSGDDTAARAREALQGSSLPFQVLARANRGAAATIDEAIALTTAPFVNVLNSDDAFEPTRIEAMIGQVAAKGRRWGFSGVRVVDAEGRDADLLADPRAYEIACRLGNVPYMPTAGLALVCANVAVTSGNLFFSRELWNAVGGFRDLRYNHDWDFALRALWLAEPVFVPDALYRYRLHGRNTIAESVAGARAESHAVVRRYVEQAVADVRPPNPDAPCLAGWGTDFVLAVLREGISEALEPATLRALVARMDAAPGVGTPAEEGNG